MWINSARAVAKTRCCGALVRAVWEAERIA
jgi:hypothetical protein